MIDFATFPSLRDKRVFIKGVTSGIGSQTMRAFAEQGAHVGFVDMDAERGKALREELGDGHAFAACDLRDIDGLRTALDSHSDAIDPD